MRPRRRAPGIGRGLAVSAGLHLAVLGLMLLGVLELGRTPLVPASEPPEVEVMLGNGSEEPGAPEPPPPPDMPEPSQATPPPVPPVAASTPTPPTPPQPAPPQEPAAPTPPPPPPPPPEPDAVPAPQPVPQVPTPAPPAPPPPTPAAASTPRPPTPPVPPARAAQPPEIRLGPIDLGFSKVDKEVKVVVAAEPDKANLPPAYPIEAQRRGEQGTVVLRVHIDATGRATQVDVAESSGYPALDVSARTRLLSWRFKPGVGSDGKAAPDTIEIGINFTLH